ncbi:MAG: hypothetical protein ACXVL8_03225 [Acidimicrobiia bacterium]
MNQVAVVGDIDAALTFLKRFVGVWAYDHDAAERTRFGPLTPGSKFPTSSATAICDCSGAVIRALVEGGMTRGHAGFGENSALMARWAEAHPEINIGTAAARNTPGALLVKGGVNGFGDAGHVAFSLGDGHTLESNSHHGLCIDDADRLVWSHGLLAPVNYSLPQQEEDDMTPEQAADLARTKALVEDLHAFMGEIRDHPPNPEQPWFGLVAKINDLAAFASELKGAGAFAWSGLVTRLDRFLPKQQ